MKAMLNYINRIFLLLALALLCVQQALAGGDGRAPKSRNAYTTDLNNPLAASTAYIVMDDPIKKVAIERKIILHRAHSWDSINAAEFDRVSLQELVGMKPAGDRLLVCIFFVDIGNGSKTSITKYFPIVKDQVIISPGNTPRIQDLFPEKK